MNKKKYQSILEYIVLIAVCVLALISMFAYIRNSISGKWRQAADVFGQGEVYSSQNTIRSE